MLSLSRSRRAIASPIRWLAVLFAAMSPIHAHAQAVWSDTSISGDIDFGDVAPNFLRVAALVSLDSGSEQGEPPSLFIGGGFITAGGVRAHGIACYRDSEWVDVSEGFLVPTATGAVTNALTLFDPDGDGVMPAQVHAAVTLRRGSNGDQHRVVRWNGAAWEQVGPMFSGVVSALTGFDPDGPGPAPADLVAGGSFTAVGGAPMSYLARWDGGSWVALPSSVNGPVQALHVHHDGDSTSLFVGGTFAQAGGLASPAVARWNGQTWATLGMGLSGSSSPAVNALGSFDFDGPAGAAPVLVVGGSFSAADGVPVANLASWNGATFAAIGAGTSRSVSSLSSHDPDGAGPATRSLYYGTSHGIARWSGTQWVAVGAGLAGPVRALHTFDEDGAGPSPPRLIAGGAFSSSGSSPLPFLAKWDGQVWSPLGHSFNHTVYSLAPYDRDGSGPQPPALFAAGEFTRVDGHVVSGLAVYEDGSWNALTPGLQINLVGRTPAGLTLLPFDEDGQGPVPPSLVLGGWFTSAGGVAASRIARFDGTEWAPLGHGLGGLLSTDAVSHLAAWDPDGIGPISPRLVAAGNFLNSGDDFTVRRLALWTGTHWTAIGGFDDQVVALTVFDEDGDGPAPNCLVVARSEGQPARVVRWDGQAWQDLGTGPATNVSSLVVIDADGSGPASPELYASCLSPGSATLIYRWDGQDWQETDTSALDAAQFAGGTRLAVHDEDGPGGAAPTLYAAGWAANAAIDPFSLARWNGARWLPVTTGNYGRIRTLASFDPDGTGGQLPALWLGGHFAAIAGVSAGRIAAVTTAPPIACAADWNRDGSFNSGDISSYLTAWIDGVLIGSLLADFNRDGLTNSGDISAFLTAWLDAVQGGC